MSAQPLQLIDIGANLTHSAFRHDLEETLHRSRAHGVVQLLITGASADGTREAYSLAQRYPGFLYATAGIHPHHANEYNDEIDALLREYITKMEVKAVGETGLDYYRDLSPRSAQLFAFEQQLQIAIDSQKPLFLHQRDAHEDFLACMDQAEGKIGHAVVHCFTGEKRELFDYLDRDFYIGITGWICDERRGLHLREIVKNIPLNRLMIETDSPYLLPRNLQPMPSHRRNEPMYLRHICREIADCRGESIQAIVISTTQNARIFFNLPSN